MKGDAVVHAPDFQGGKVWINEKQRFENIPEQAWEFPVGGYKPAQTWLKARIGRRLNFDDIVHYQKIIKVLSETGRIMKNIVIDLA